MLTGFPHDHPRGSARRVNSALRHIPESSFCPQSSQIRQLSHPIHAGLPFCTPVAKLILWQHTEQHAPLGHKYQLRVGENMADEAARNAVALGKRLTSMSMPTEKKQKKRLAAGCNSSSSDLGEGSPRFSGADVNVAKVDLTW